ncbi:unnamed protein product [Pleuronectes platessa]|uniref:Uncharacterized protein n=1 Tax=Pleuronectes platessa TaxID=8262 RepID=A0A9N7V3I5_PLEPL|nr:unnamed protein product [Pleuronectes platessa]
MQMVQTGDRTADLQVGGRPRPRKPSAHLLQRTSPGVRRTSPAAHISWCAHPAYYISCGAHLLRRTSPAAHIPCCVHLLVRTSPAAHISWCAAHISCGAQILLRTQNNSI